jgi:4-aminobutyrate aminotransferase-like enzyme
LSPPLTVRKEEIDKIVDVVDKSIGEVERSML